MDPKNPWRNRVENTMRDTEIDEEELLTKKQPQAKKYITEKLKEYQINKIYKAAETKSKVRDYICNKTRATVTARPLYCIFILHICSNIDNKPRYFPLNNLITAFIWDQCWYNNLLTDMVLNF